MISVIIGGRDYSSRVLDCRIDINDSWLGKLVANEATVLLDNSDDFFTLDTSGNVQNGYSELVEDGLTVTIDIDGVRKFTGYVHRSPRLSVNRKTIQIKAKDKWKQFDKKYCQNKVYLNASFLTVLQDLIQQGGESLGNTSLEDPGLTITFWHVADDKKLTDALTELVKSVGGQLYYDENGILIFKAGFRSAFSTTTKATFTVSKISDLELSYSGEKYDLVEVKTNSKVLKDKLRPIYVGATADDPLDVPSAGLPEDNDDGYYAQLDKPIWYLDDYANVDWEAPSGVALDQTTYESNFQDIANHVPANPYKLTLKITNTTGTDKQVTDFKIYGKEVEEETLIAYYPTTTSNTKYSFESEIIPDKVWATALAKWLYEELAVRPEVELPITSFSEGLNFTIGDKVILYDASTGLSHRYVIRAIKIDYKNSKITLSAIQDRDAFVEPSGIEKRSVPQKNVIHGEQIIGTIQGSSQTTKYNLTDDVLTVGASVAMGKEVLDDNTDGISVNNGKIQIKSNTNKLLLGANGIRQIYNISLVDQIDSQKTLEIPIYIPKNADGSENSTGVARIKVKAEKFRAYSKATEYGGSSELNIKDSGTTSTIWDGSLIQISTTGMSGTPLTPNDITVSSLSGGSHTHTASVSVDNAGSHSHSFSETSSSSGYHYHTLSGSTGVEESHTHTVQTVYGTSTTSSAGGHSHSVAGQTDSKGSHTHSVSGTTGTSGSHTHNASVTIDSDGEHTHDVPIPDHLHSILLSDLKHSHDFSIDATVDISHKHSLDYGIYESPVIAQVTIKHTDNSDPQNPITTTKGTVTTDDMIDINNVPVSDGDVITISADNLARVQVFIFVEYMLY